MAIVVRNFTTSKIKEDFFENIASKILYGEIKNIKSGLSIVLVGSKRIKDLNNRYRGKNKITDVLSFTGSENFHGLSKKELEIGEILICVSEVKKNAKKTNSPFKKELALVLIHGILHILGYDHEKSDNEAKKMEKKQKYYISRIKF